ncbi:flagellar protein FlaG [Vibrio sp. RC27]
MDITSYTSNIQSYGSKSGTKFASESETAKSILTPQQVNRADDAQERTVEKTTDSVEEAIKLAKQHERSTEEQRVKTREQMQEFVSSINKDLSFSVDTESGREVMTIYEAETGDVIRQIPEEEMLEVLRRLAKEQDHHTGLVMTKV